MIIPTYNEAKSIPFLLGQTVKICLEHGIDEKILVIDDNSPDGTARIARDYKENYPHIIEVYQRKEKLGLGSAYRFGFSKALQEKADYIIQMDADLSHNPRSIPRFLETCKNSDLVVGSRYVEHGRIKNWSLPRKLISRAGSLYAKNVLTLPVQDTTSGFRCIRTSCLRTIAVNSIRADGYGFQIELLYLFWKHGLRIKEIPIEFTERRMGKSKFSKKIALEAFLKVLELRKSN
ncbi:polyprenol monophosphomannose synthase [Patescibacteria group bacterium]|nr:polyprenol monophosphomannose synthase [Patescibacteria group bacterium]